MSGGPIRFRRVTAADGTDFFELRRKAILGGCSGYYSDPILQAWTDPLTDGRLGDPIAEHFYFAQIDQQIAGSGMIDIHTARIDAVFVHPTFFRRGVGTAVMRHLEDIASRHGLRHLVLDATLNAVGFYRSLGFEGDATGTYTSPRGLSLPCVSMTRRLPTSGSSS